MIVYVTGDLFQSPARLLVNPVNTVGVMGKGLAFDFKRFYPDMFTQYKEFCQRDQFDIGHLYLYKTPHKWVLNFPTKKHFRAYSRTEYLEAGLKKFVQIYSEQGITSASFPMLGTGYGNLDWETEVRPIMEAYLQPIPLAIYVHLNHENDPFAPERRNVRGIRSWLNGRPRVVDFTKFWRDLSRLIKSKPYLQTHDSDKELFYAGISTKKRSRRHNLVIRTSAPQPIFISESSVRDLWQYIRRTGYVLPQNLPGGLSEHAQFLFALLAKLDYLRPVYLRPAGGEQVVGLHYVPPLDRKDNPHLAPLKAVE